MTEQPLFWLAPTHTPDWLWLVKGKSPAEKWVGDHVGDVMRRLCYDPNSVWLASRVHLTASIHSIEITQEVMDHPRCAFIIAEMLGL